MAAATFDSDVLIAGAGPTGLVLALCLARRGIRVSILDRTAAPGTTSRALAVQARTLEFYSQVGLADTVVTMGRRVEAVNLWVGGRRRAHAVLGEIGAGISPFPYALVFPQDEHEQLLVDRLLALGVAVERETTLAGFDDEQDRIRARLQTGKRSDTTCFAQFIAGCDGTHSTDRDWLLIRYPGGTYEHTF